MRDFSPVFIQWFVETFYTGWVTGVSGIGFEDEDDLLASEKMFRRLGLPGIVSSMDGVHCSWERAPYAKKWQVVGKEGISTLGWNVHVLANGKIIYITPPQPGGTNDETFLSHDKTLLRDSSPADDELMEPRCEEVDDALEDVPQLCPPLSEAG